MLFNSLEFFIFLPIVLGVYYTLSFRAQNAWLLVASYVFYGSWDWRFLSLILISTAVDYWVGNRLGRAEGSGTRKRLLTLSMVTNLGILGAFKYYGFVVGSAAAMIESFDFQPHITVLQFVLPVGISFYTFQTMSYTIDVYRRRIAPTRDLLNFGLYVAYCPQLVAGPPLNAPVTSCRCCRQKGDSGGSISPSGLNLS